MAQREHDDGFTTSLAFRMSFDEADQGVYYMVLTNCDFGRMPQRASVLAEVQYTFWNPKAGYLSTTEAPTLVKPPLLPLLLPHTERGHSRAPTHTYAHTQPAHIALLAAWVVYIMVWVILVWCRNLPVVPLHRRILVAPCVKAVSLAASYMYWRLRADGTTYITYSTSVRASLCNTDAHRGL